MNCPNEGVEHVYTSIEEEGEQAKEEEKGDAEQSEEAEEAKGISTTTPSPHKGSTHELDGFASTLLIFNYLNISLYAVLYLNLFKIYYDAIIHIIDTVNRAKIHSSKRIFSFACWWLDSCEGSERDLGWVQTEVEDRSHLVLDGRTYSTVHNQIQA